MELTKPCSLVFDVSKFTKRFDPMGGSLDAWLPVDLIGKGGIVQIHALKDPAPRTIARALRWPTGDSPEALWLVGDRNEEGFLSQWLATFERWFPPHPLTIAPFDNSRRSFQLPDEIQFFRDDLRLQKQLLDDAGRQRMDNLWAYLYLLSDEPRMRLSIFTGKHQIADLDAEAQLAKLQDRPARALNHRYGNVPQDLPARLEFYRQELNQQRALWRKRTLVAVTELASRAWRRPLTPREIPRLHRLYNILQQKPDFDSEEALRTMVMRVLVSPHFLFRCEKTAADGKEAPLNAWELATRLSLFLWASLPDDELRKRASDGSLLREDVLRKQVRRMLADPSARGMAEHFFGQWLGFAGFDRGASDPDVKVFPTYTPEVRRSLHQEAVTFFEDLIRNDRDVHLIFNADYSFLNGTLRQYYGLEASPAEKNRKKPRNSATDSKPAETLFERTSVRSVGRGGALGLGAILVRNSRTQRTSPTNRGVWVVENLLGRHLPSPPANVPIIPDRSDVNQKLSLRQQLLQHRSNPACAACHARIDPFGFAFEAFDAAGLRRPEMELKKIEYETTRDGERLDGLEALRSWLNKRSKEVNRNLARRMLGYALNRPVAVSDAPLIERALADLPKKDYRLSSIVEHVVLSRQFRYRRSENRRERIDKGQ